MKKVYVDFSLIEEIEEVGNQLRGISCALDGLRVAMEYGPFSADSYLNGFIHLNAELDELNKRLFSLADGATNKTNEEDLKISNTKHATRNV